MKATTKLAALAAAALALSSCGTTDAARLASSWTTLGNTWADLGYWDKAGLAWSEALRLDPTQAVAGYNLARALAEAGKYDEAVQAADAVLAKDPDNASVLAVKAYALHKAGRNAEAAAVYRRVVVLNAEDTASSFNLAVLLEEGGQLDEALARYLAILDAKPDDAAASLRAGVVLDALGRSEEAVPYLERYTVATPASLEAKRVLADVCERAGLYMKSMEALLAVLAGAKDDADAWFQLGRLRLTVADDAEGGLDALAKAAAAGFDDEDAARTLLDTPGLPERQRVEAALAPVFDKPDDQTDPDDDTPAEEGEL
ncbi:MAG TPA: tetratricopeptide repeat protein [Spirochaetales bacterium]|nr:tetratricopeptide repeat protein [Spirochaetales bacterium]